MASNTTGERRWGSTRKGGMTILGKVAVPKPINLPSQRLENHGVDPSVEIVPKGSLSWGNRSSSSGSNAWGSSSALSPTTEGGGHLSGRPSSSGGTRPSTAGSDRNPDTSSNAWIANSRPSSASRVLSANTSSLAALRPHSAENRPGSSQLSRFAEPLSEGTRAFDKPGVAAPLNDGFSLSSGDFPVLGEEKVSGKDAEILDCDSHSRPGSSGPSATLEAGYGVQADDISQHADAKNSPVNSWENNVPNPGMERWHGDSYPYPNHNFPSHPYESWRGGPPVNPPGGVWFRGPPGAPPYGAPQMTAAGGFPMEPFPYYCPPVQAPPGPHAGSRPSGPHSQSGDLCRPYMEPPYMRPGMPMRPGFYPGYYGQPMGFRGPNERDFSIMGRPSGPPVINQYPNQNAHPEPINSNTRSSGGRAHEQVDLCPPLLGPRATSPVKQIMGWDKNVKEDSFGHKFTANVHPHEKRHAANASSQDNVRTEDPRQYKQIYSGKRSLHNEQAPSLIDGKIGATDPAHMKYHGNVNSAKSADVNPAVENLALPKDQTLIQKIEGLNAKVRAPDGKHEIPEEEPNGRGQSVKSNFGVNEAGASVRLERHYPSGIRVPVPHDRAILPDNKGFGSTSDCAVTTVSRHSSHNLQGKGGNGSKGRPNSQEGWRKRSAIAEPQGIVSVLHSETAINIERKEQQPAEMSTADQEGNDNSKSPMLDPSIGQHANMKEITKQRAIQLQREEEERIREQKAKAFAKLAELNRRSANQGKETSRQKMDDVASNPESIQKQDEVQNKIELKKQDEVKNKTELRKQDDVKNKIELQFGSFQSGEIGVALPSGYNPSKTAKSSTSNVSSGSISSQTNLQLHHEDSVPLRKTSLAVGDAQSNDSSSKQKGAGYKQKYGGQSGKHQAEKSTVPGKEKGSATIAAPKEVNGKSTVPESNLRVDSPTVSDSLLHQKRKNKSGKNKHIVEEAFSVSPTFVQKESESMKLSAVEQKSHKSDSVVWAPVKSHAKMEVAERNDQKADGGSVPSNRNDSAVLSSFKGRRAEIERYIPKAAIKELAQQGSDQRSTSPLIEKSIPDGHASSQTTERIKRNVESKLVENKNKQWHQRTPTASNSIQVSVDGKNSQTPDGAHQSQKSKELVKGSVAKPVAQIVEVQQSKQDEQTQEDNAVDGWVIYDEPVSSASGMISNMEDHGKSTRGRKNPYKGNKGSRNQQNIELESHAGYVSEASQVERPRSSKEHVPQWQPRPQTRVTNQHENFTRGRQNATGEGDKFYKREGFKDAGSELKQQNLDTEKNPVLPKNYVAERRDVSNTGNQKNKASLEDRAHSPNKNTVGDFEADWSNNDQRPSSSGNRWNGNYNGRPIRGRDFHGARSFIPQENRQNHAREKQRQNSRYEYQPVGPYNRNKNSERQSENQNAGSKYRDRGQGGHLQRGGASFSGWQRVNQTDADYE